MSGWQSFAIALLALSISSAAVEAIADEVRGTAVVVDGDTVTIGDRKIRLEGIDAPETDQVCLQANGAIWTCGLEAKKQLDVLARRGAWSCRVSGNDRYGRNLATCFVDEKNVERLMVANGWALAFVRYSKAYETEEKAARERQAGLWAGAFIAPWDWRARNQRTLILGSSAVPSNAQKILLSSASAADAPSLDCTIKANFNRNGECIFHRVGQRSYAKLKMDSDRKRWFCTQDEAAAAGCRPAKQ